MEEEDRLAKLEEEENNPMKALENRTVDSKREMDILDALQDIRARNARNERVGQSVDLIERIGMEEIETEEEKERKRLEEEDEKLIREVFAKVPVDGAGASSSHSPEGSAANGEVSPPAVVTLKRKADGVEPDVQSLLPEETRALISSKTKAFAPPPLKKKKTDLKGTLGIKINKGKAVAKRKVAV